MLEKPGYEVVAAAANTFEAQFLAGALQDEGIPTHVDEDHLADEFAMSQKMMGLQKVRVMVPKDRLDDARAIIAALPDREPADGDSVPWEQPGGESDEAPPARAPTAGRGAYLFWMVLFAGAAIVMTFLYLQERAINLNATGSDGVFTWGWVDGKLVSRWNDGGALASIAHDADADGYAEQTEHFDRQGRKTTIWLDENEDGTSERSFHFVPANTKWAYCAWDDDEDSHPETIVYPTAGGRFWRWIDEDKDGYWEVRELVKEDDGTVLMRHEDAGEEGFRRTK